MLVGAGKGWGVLARQTLKGDGRLLITVPETVETTAEDLAPALAAA
jgi:hypothetical protein